MFGIPQNRLTSKNYSTPCPGIYSMTKASLEADVKALIESAAVLSNSQQMLYCQSTALLAFCYAIMHGLPEDRSAVATAFATAVDQFRPSEEAMPNGIGQFDSICELLSVALKIPPGTAIPPRSLLAKHESLKKR